MRCVPVLRKHCPSSDQLLCYSVSEDLLCAFELLKPLDGQQLRKEMSKAKRKRYVLEGFLRPVHS